MRLGVTRIRDVELNDNSDVKLERARRGVAVRPNSVTQYDWD